MRLLLLFLFPIVGFCQNTIRLSSGLQKQEIRDNLFVLKDFSDTLSINDFLDSKQDYFQSSALSIPSFNWGKRTGWVRLELNSEKDTSHLFHVNSPIFDKVSFYLVQNKQIIQSTENLGCLTPVINRPYVHRDFVFPIHLKSGNNYTIYLKGRSLLSPVKFPLIVWQANAFEKNERQLDFFWGFIIGILLLIVLGNFVIGYLLKMRIFYFYGMYVSSLILLFLHLDGFLYEYVPAHLLWNNIYNLTPYFSYSTFFWNILFVIAFTKISLADRPVFERILRLLGITFWLLLLPVIFSPLWLAGVSDTFLQVLGWAARVIMICLLVFLYITVFASVRKNAMSRIYIISVIPATFSYILPQYFNHILDIWIVQPYAYLVGFFLEILILSVAMIANVKEYLFTNKGQIALEPQAQTIVGGTENKIINEKVLSKREIEILTAFAKGFTYQDISDAMFISPHTVRTHLKNIYQKLDINSKAEAVKVAIERGWL